MSRSASGRKTGAPTISDVARVANTSAMTVSRIMNGKRTVDDAVHEAVSSAVRQLGYNPNGAARTLAGVDRFSIALLYREPVTAYLGELLVGCLEQAERDSLRLVLARYGSEDDPHQVADRLIAAGIAGVVLPPPLCDVASVVDLFIAAEVPTVVIATGHATVAAGSVRIDELLAARGMTRHLLSLGHRRIGFITGARHLTASWERLAGYRGAIEEFGLDYDDDLVARGSFTFKSGVAAAELLIDQPDRPTAIFASNDDMAVAAVSVAHRRGLVVPDDITVCGFDDTSLARAVWPELTTVHQPIAEMARTAVSILSRDLRVAAGARHLHERQVVMPHKLLRRQSDAAPAAANREICPATGA